MAKRHLLNLSKKALPQGSKWFDFETPTGDITFVFTLYTYENASGFVHFAIMSKDYRRIADAKAQYYNRTWERFEGQSVYRQCVEWALKSNDITEEQAEFLKEALK